MLTSLKKKKKKRNNSGNQLLSTYSVQYSLLSVLHIIVNLVLIINTIKLLFQLFGQRH